MALLARGSYDRLVTAALRENLSQLPETLRAEIEGLSVADAVEYVAREVAARIRASLKGWDEEAAVDALRYANSVFASTREPEAVEFALLTAVRETIEKPPVRPLIPLSQSALVTNDQGLNLHAILRSELLSADRVDLICPFIGNQGLNLLFDALAEFGSRLRVVTTTYLGGTNARALERLAGIGAQVKIVYERPEQRTSLHAKAWIFHRDSGHTTATVGSSNLSPKALVDGLEWNVRLGQDDAPQVLEELRVTFERLWEDSRYETFDPQRDGERLGRALRDQRSEKEGGNSFFADLAPLPHQREALDELAYSRLEGRSENLIVAATGTGKTLLAAFDYARMAREMGGRPSLLFVAHREEILKQSIGAFRAVLRDSDFGEMNVGDARAEVWRHAFASVQSLAARDLAQFDPRRFDMIVVDEFHHAAAPTYARILDHFRPKQLLALTATPERADGHSVIDRFGAPTYELRLWHALDRGLLCPFHYFGVDDGTDLSKVAWVGGKYADADLDKVYVDAGDARAATIIRELFEKAADVEAMRAVAFCATIRHAIFMAQRFRDAGLDAHALHSGLSPDERKTLMRRFRAGEIRVLCTVDLLNEGVDVPEIDTVLFLRPTESATVFVQQLGRGLRNHMGKGALTVLDFVGGQNRRFRMDLRFGALTGFLRRELGTAVEEGFPSLPPGCHIRLDRTTQERVLRSLRDAVPTGSKRLVEELRRMASAGVPLTLASFLQETGLEPGDLYRGGRSLASLLDAAGLGPPATESSRRIESLLHVDDRRRLAGYLDALAGERHDRDLRRMLRYRLTGSVADDALEKAPEEAAELLRLLLRTARVRPRLADDLPFALHSHYSQDEIVAPFRDNPRSMRQGTFYDRDREIDVHLLTLRKSERHFSPTTRYADYFLAPDRLHWESQSTTSAGSPTGQRLIEGVGRHLFFVREAKDEDGRTSPFLCLGFGKPLSHEGEKPIRLVWGLESPVPDHLYPRLRSAAG